MARKINCQKRDMISIKRNRIKNIVLILLIIIFLGLVALVFYNNGYMETAYNAFQGEKTEKNIIDEISINNVVLTYDEENNTYYFPITINDENKNQQLEIKIKSLENIKCKIEDKEFSKRIDLYEKINYDKTIEINVESFFYKWNCKIKFTNIPIVSLNYDENQIGAEEYIYSEFSLTDPNYKKNNSQYQYNGDSKVRYRGNSTLGYGKKSYRIKLDKNIEFGFLGMNSAKTWILDSIVTDGSNLRTKLASDLWGEINKDLDNKKYAELNSEYVEVYINGKYNGLYLLKEVVDENLLNLDKNTGVLLKGVTWDRIDFNDYNNVNSDYRTPFELKYPKNASKYSKSWVDILDKMKEYYNGNMSYDTIDKTFYIENFVNHKIFLLITQAIDNYEFKNIYYSIENDKKDTKVLITPWDLDLTFGLLWSNEASQYIERYEKVEDIVVPIGIGPDKQFDNYIKERWKFLSKSVLSKENMNNTIDKQYDYLTKAQALQRDDAKYNNSEKTAGIEAMKDWYSKRFDIIDGYIKSIQ